MIDPPFTRVDRLRAAIGAARPIPYIIARGRPSKRDRGRPHFLVAAAAGR
jgi:hypothetical protein